MPVVVSYRYDWFRIIEDISREGLTLSDIAKELDVSKTAVIGWKQGLNPVTLLVMLLSLCGATLNKDGRKTCRLKSCRESSFITTHPGVTQTRKNMRTPHSEYTPRRNARNFFSKTIKKEK
jgi:transcriptional regulator with XRE-family HTH domain